MFCGHYDSVFCNVYALPRCDFQTFYPFTHTVHYNAVHVGCADRFDKIPTVLCIGLNRSDKHLRTRANIYPDDFDYSDENLLSLRHIHTTSDGKQRRMRTDCNCTKFSFDSEFIYSLVCCNCVF